MTKKRRFRNLKNLLKDLQPFLSFPTSPGYQDPPKNAILISSDHKKGSMNSQNKSIFTTNGNEKQFINETQ